MSNNNMEKSQIQFTQINDALQLLNSFAEDINETSHIEQEPTYLINATEQFELMPNNDYIQENPCIRNDNTSNIATYVDKIILGTNSVQELQKILEKTNFQSLISIFAGKSHPFYNNIKLKMKF